MRQISLIICIISMLNATVIISKPMKLRVNLHSLRLPENVKEIRDVLYNIVAAERAGQKGLGNCDSDEDDKDVCLGVNQKLLLIYHRGRGGTDRKFLSCDLDDRRCQLRTLKDIVGRARNGYPGETAFANSHVDSNGLITVDIYDVLA